MMGASTAGLPDSSQSSSIPAIGSSVSGGETKSSIIGKSSAAESGAGSHMVHLSEAVPES